MQNGDFDAWPQDVVCGKSKTMIVNPQQTLSYWPRTIRAELVRINDGTLDFMISLSRSLQSANYSLVVSSIYSEAQILNVDDMAGCKVELNRTRDYGNYTVNGRYCYLPYLNEYSDITDRPNDLIETDFINSDYSSITISRLEDSSYALFTASQSTGGFPVITRPLKAQKINAYYLFRDYTIILPAVFRIGNPAAV